MREKIFRFKQFSIHNDKCAMKVGTDGVLLGAWCDVKNASSVLDVGTGSGLIAMMIAQRNTNASIKAIDIEENAIAEASENFINCPWSERLHAELIDFNVFADNCTSRFDLIVSNPPFFVNSLKSPIQNRTMARHTDSLSFHNLLSGAARLLSDNGKICIITPADCADSIADIARKAGIFISQKVFIQPTPQLPPKRILWQFSKMQCHTITSQLAIEISRHIYTDDYINLTKNFYLKM